MRLKDLIQKTRKIVVTISEETAEVEYRLHAISVSYLEELGRLAGMESVISQVVQIVIRWDVLDENGKEIPVTAEAIRQYEIPVEFLTAVLNGITDDHKADADAKNA